MVGWVLTNSWESIDTRSLVCLQNLGNSWLTVDWDVDQVLIEYWSRFNQEYWSMLDCECLQYTQSNGEMCTPTPHSALLSQLWRATLALTLASSNKLLYFECMILFLCCFLHCSFNWKDLKTVRQKYSSISHIFSSLLSVWNCAQMQFFVFKIVHNSPSPQYSRERSAGIESERSACRIPRGSSCALLWPRICNKNFNSWDMF